MAWFRLEESLPNHPKIVKLSRRLRCGEVAAVGHVVSLWCWVIANNPDGVLDGIDSADLAIAGKWPGDEDDFRNALIGVRLLYETDGGLIVHGWERRAESYKNAGKQKEYRSREKEKLEALRKPGNGYQRVTNHEVTVTTTDRQTDVPTDRQKRVTRINSPESLKISEEATDIANYFRERFPGKGRAVKPGHADYSRIKARLDEGFTVSDLFLAVEGLRVDKWHKEKQRQIAESVFRNSSKVETLISAARKEQEEIRRQPRGTTANESTS